MNNVFTLNTYTFSCFGAFLQMFLCVQQPFSFFLERTIVWASVYVGRDLPRFAVKANPNAGKVVAPFQLHNNNTDSANNQSLAGIILPPSNFVISTQICKTMLKITSHLQAHVHQGCSLAERRRRRT